MELKGKLIEIFKEQQISESFKKRECVIEYAENPQYPEMIKMETIQDKCSLLDSYSVGQEVTVQFNLKGRKWVDPKGEAKYFNTMQIWKIEGESVRQVDQTEPVKPEQYAFKNDFKPEEEQDQLPF